MPPYWPMCISGYGWALRRRGQLGPVQEGAVRRKLMATIARLAAADHCFRRRRGSCAKAGPQERVAVEATLGELAVTPNWF